MVFFVSQLLEGGGNNAPDHRWLQWQCPENAGRSLNLPTPRCLSLADWDDKDLSPAGFQIHRLIEESHISIHTFPERSYINIDIFSCKEFDAEQTIRDLQQQFGLDEIRSYILNRGLEYYNNQQPSSLSASVNRK